MPKEFYTERDIEDMVKRGILSLEINDNVVLTDLAYEKANRLGMRLVRDKPDNPPAAPVRPYLSQQQTGQAARTEPSSFSPFTPPRQSSPGATQSAYQAQPQAVPQSLPLAQPPANVDVADLHQRIRSAVIARLGSQVDANLLDTIIKRVLQSTGIR
jgi:hypothetical protein